MLTANGLTKSFGDTLALDDVNVSISPGRITVVIGPSGSGKTTLLRAVSLLDPPKRGEIVLEGTTYTFPLGSLPPCKPPWPKLTVVFQQLFLWPHLTLRQNILLPVNLRGGDTSSLNELLDLFRMTDFVDRYPNEVSIGQRQRAALARAVMLNPAYILLDEITSALDIEQTSIIMNYLLSLRDRGIGLLVVTHLIGFARRLLTRQEGDHIVFLDKGRVLESGGIEVLKSPRNERAIQFLAAIEMVE